MQIQGEKITIYKSSDIEDLIRKAIPDFIIIDWLVRLSGELPNEPIDILCIEYGSKLNDFLLEDEEILIMNTIAEVILEHKLDIFYFSHENNGGSFILYIEFYK